jgi:hypothetical protein
MGCYRTSKNPVLKIVNFKNMKLNQNSISARLYRWFYLTEDMPKNLCPYFWKLVFMYILLIPATILYLPLFVIRNEATEIGERIAISIVSWIAVGLALLMIFPITYFFYGWFPPNTTFGAWQTIGMAIWVVLIVCSTTWGILEIGKKRREKKRKIHCEFIWNEDGHYIPNPNYVPYEYKPNIIIEFIKASYNKYCPRIEWNNEK